LLWQALAGTLTLYTLTLMFQGRAEDPLKLF
jgi:hypothetical protein